MEPGTLGPEKQLARPHWLTIEPRDEHQAARPGRADQRGQPLQRRSAQRRRQRADGGVWNARELLDILDATNLEALWSFQRSSRCAEVTQHGGEVLATTQPPRLEQLRKVARCRGGRDPQRHAATVFLIARHQRVEPATRGGRRESNHDGRVPPRLDGVNEPRDVPIAMNLRTRQRWLRQQNIRRDAARRARPHRGLAQRVAARSMTKPFDGYFFCS